MEKKSATRVIVCYDIVVEFYFYGVYKRKGIHMNYSFKERVKRKLVSIGRKNLILRILVIPLLFVSMFLIRSAEHLMHNAKRLAFMALTFVTFVVYSSFSFPMFIFSEESENRYGFVYDEFSEVVLVEEQYVDLERVELGDVELDNEELPDDVGITVSDGDGLLEESTNSDWYDADDILMNSERRENWDKDRAARRAARSEKEAVPLDYSKDDWKLILVNKQRPIPDDYSFELGTIKGSMKCDERIIDDLLDMIQDAKDDGVNLVIRSPYRSDDRQVYLFNRHIKSYMRMGMSYLEAYQLTSQAVTLPGSSEHQIGLALDITCDYYGSLNEGFGDTEAGKWLAENSSKYGFILRYPLGKEYITGIEFEPWHFRYVGVDAATIIANEQITLEEFWDDYVH